MFSPIKHQKAPISPHPKAPIPPPQYIEHGVSLTDRWEYAEKIKAVAAYYYDGTRWNPGPNSHRQKVVLVEVWRLLGPGKVEIHPSRNPFFPVSDSRQKSMWHALATNPYITNISESGERAQAAHKPGTHLQIDHPKPKEVPNWAKEDNVIGYTSPLAITNPDFNSIVLIQDLAAVPSVYYWSGHKTIDHPGLGNIGWDNKFGWHREFFGNVPSVFAHRP